MKTISKIQIERRVKQFIRDMENANPNYPNEVSHDVIIHEILQANGWFPDISEPAKLIREEVKRQFEKYLSKKETVDDGRDNIFCNSDCLAESLMAEEIYLN